MPTFPTYPGKLPSRLNPFNPWHYFLLAYWLYFRPTAFRCYLYQADPDFYRSGPGINIFRSVAKPAYCNLYVIALILTLCLSLCIGVPVVEGESLLQGVESLWSEMAVGVAVGVAVGIAVGVAFGVAVGVAVGVAFGVAVGVAFGVAIGVAFSVAGSVAGDVAVGVAFGVAGSVAFGVAGSVAVGVAFGVAFSVAGDVAGGVAGGVAALRLIFYGLQGGGFGNRHPLLWDELSVMPFLKSNQIIKQAWKQGEQQGVQFLSQVASNPFQRWVVQRGLYSYLHCHRQPLQFLYALLQNPNLDAYVIVPIYSSDWHYIPSIRRVFLSELGGLNTEEDLNRLVWTLTQKLRYRQVTPLTQLAASLYVLITASESDTLSTLNLASYHPIYSQLMEYPGGDEIYHSFEYMRHFLASSSLVEIASHPDLCNPSGPNVISSEVWLCREAEKQKDTLIRPSVIDALQRFGRVSQEIGVYLAATSHLNRLAALVRANDVLEKLQTYIDQSLVPPEQGILLEIIKRWRKLINEASGAEGSFTITEPITNPYVAGNPVSGDLFVGREDILRELEELWMKPGLVDSVVLYGHRRMGKSSILKNLSSALDVSYNWIVDFNMQRKGNVRNTAELLFTLTRDMGKVATRQSQLHLELPNDGDFLGTNSNPYMTFNTWLDDLSPHMENHRFIIAIDEFELIETKIDQGKLDVELIAFLRGIIQTFDWFVVAMAGLYTLQEKTEDYWNPLFGSIKPRKVSFLSPPAARRLLTQPSDDFPLDYTQDALDEIIHLTNGQPYLLQLIGQNLVSRFNHQVFEEDMDSDRPLTLQDVNAVIFSKTFFQDGGAYFSGVWSQAQHSEPDGQTTLLDALANGNKTIDELAIATDLSIPEVTAALKTLENHDVVTQDDDMRYGFTVELMRRWVAQRSA
ncbi:MAG: ATP-binding protein [Cyanobacteria bacterium P01_F01_bin.150]